ncbi:MAG: hypothetical protein U1F53_07815 [Burkholderiaceae bacterium]
MSTRLIHLAAAAACLAATAFSAPAQAGVSWSIGINAPIAPGVHVGTVIGGGRPMVGVGIAPVYAPAPVVYAPPPVYVPPPVYAPAPVVYEPAYPAVVVPPPVYVSGGYYYGHRHPGYHPRPVYYRPPVVRPPVMARPIGGAVMSRPPVYGNGYGPVAQR